MREIKKRKISELENIAELHLAVQSGDLNQVEKILISNDKYYVNQIDSYGKTALHYACMNKQPDYVKMLLNYGADVDVRDFNGKTCYYYVDDLSLLKLCLLKTIDSISFAEFIKNMKKEIATIKNVEQLILACVHDSFTNFVDFIFKNYPAYTSRSLLLYNLGVVKQDNFFKKDLKKNELYKNFKKYFVQNNKIDTDAIIDLLVASDLVNVQDEQGKTFLHYACIYNKLDFAEKLLANGADALQLYNGKPLLYYAFINNNKETLFLILSMLSTNQLNSLLDLDLKVDFKACLLLYYKRFNNLIALIKNAESENKNKIFANKIFKNLLQNKDLKDDNNNGILYYVIIRKDLEMVKFFLNCRVVVDANSVAFAIIYDLKDIFSLLHAGSAKVRNLIDDFIIKEIKNIHINGKVAKSFHFLFNKFFSMSLRDCHGNNILHCTAYFGNLEVFKYVFARAKDLINEKNGQGLTPIDIAIYNPDASIINYFIEKSHGLAQGLVNNNDFLNLEKPLLVNATNPAEDKENNFLNLS